MAAFDEREKDFEARYKHDQELQFKVKARRNRLLGLWAAGSVFRVKMPEGTLVVEVNVPNPDVLVDGKKMTVQPR